VNSASTDLAALMDNTQVPVPEQPAPLQPVKVECTSAAAVRVTVEPWLNDAVHVAPQSIPRGEDNTDPVPVPDKVTSRSWVIAEKVAVTEVAAVIVTTQVPVPPQPPPLQPVNVELASGVAVRVTTVPWLKFIEQVAPQLTPGGLLVTVPSPVPPFVTVSV
jgi:hypothetical protein